MSFTRQKSKGRIGAEGETFARVPTAVLESEACKTLPHAAFKLLVVIASQWRRYTKARVAPFGNNGTLALTPQYAELFGIKGKNTVYRALYELERRGLLVITRQGLRMRRQFTLYALGWEDIDNRDGKPLDRPEPRKNDRWQLWPLNQVLVGERQTRDKTRRGAPGRDAYLREKRVRWRHRSVPAAGNDAADSGTRSGESSVPAAGNDLPVSVPAAVLNGTNYVPAAGNTSRTLEGSRVERHAGVTDQRRVGDLNARIRRLIRSQPHLTDSEVASTFKGRVDALQVARLRSQESMQ